MDKHTQDEYEYLEWYRMSIDFGPAHEDVIGLMDEQYTEETGKQVPPEWRAE